MRRTRTARIALRDSGAGARRDGSARTEGARPRARTRRRRGPRRTGRPSQTSARLRSGSSSWSVALPSHSSSASATDPHRRAQIGDSAVQGYLDAETTVSEVVQRMKALSQDDFVALVEVRSRPPLRFCECELNKRHAAPSSRPDGADLHDPPPDCLPRDVLAPARRRRATASDAVERSAQHHPRLAACLASPTRRDGLAPETRGRRVGLLARAEPLVLRPLGLGLSLVVIRTAHRSRAARTARRAAARSCCRERGRGLRGKGPGPERPDGLSRRAQDEAHRFVLVKEALVELLLAGAECDEAAGDGRAEEERERVLRRVREAMDGVEEVVQAAGAKKA